MYYIIGTYQHQKIILGLKMYDSETGKMGMYHTTNVLDAVRSGKVIVAGVEVRDEVKLSNTMYKVRALDQVDDNGICKEVYKKIPLEIEGFGESATVLLIDCMGETERVSYKEFIDLIDAGRIVGAKHGMCDTVMFHKYIIKKGIAL